MPAQHTAPSRARDYGVDLHAGADLALGSFLVTEENLVEFARAWDPQDFHTDGEAAEAGAYGGFIASGIQTIAIYQLLAVREVFSHWAVIAGRGFRDIRFLRPVRPGDTLTGTMHLESVHFDARERALVEIVATLANQRGELVLRLNAEVYVRSRPEPLSE